MRVRRVGHVVIKNTNEPERAVLKGELDHEKAQDLQNELFRRWRGEEAMGVVAEGGGVEGEEEGKFNGWVKDEQEADPEGE